MTYSVGGTISASDINGWLSTVNTLWGVGSGNRGYGQTSTQAAVSTGATINAAHWSNLRSMINSIATHQGTSATNLVPSSFLTTGNTIYAHVSGSGNNAYDINTLVSTIDTNRLSAASDMSLTSNAYTLVKAASWASTTSVVFDVAFGSEDAARYFFNTGGQIRVRLVPTSTLLGSSAAQDIDWRDVVNNKVGTFTLSAGTTVRSGSAGAVANGGAGAQGFYGLNATNTTIYNGTNIGGTGYTVNDVLIQAAVRNVVGTNGGNGNTVRVTVQLNDDHTNVNYDSVSAGMSVAVDYYKAGTTVWSTATAAPTITTVTAWS